MQRSWADAQAISEVSAPSRVGGLASNMYDEHAQRLRSGVKNPIRLARSILDHSQIPDALGRIPPMFVVF